MSTDNKTQETTVNKETEVDVKSPESLAKANDGKTLNSMKLKLQKEKIQIQNTEAVENSRLQSTLNTLATEQAKYVDNHKQYEELKPQVEAAKKATAEKIKKIDDQVDVINQAINLRLSAGEIEIQERIAKMSNTAAAEGFKKFTAGKTPDQDVKEQGEKGFQNVKGTQAESADLKKLEEEDAANKKKNQQGGK